MEEAGSRPASAIGRYRAGPWMRWLILAYSPFWVVKAVRSPDPFSIALAVLWSLLAIASWTIPKWIITSRDVQRPLLRRIYP